jgi:uncharacterized protein with ParB-like and HNH nuclease domain
MYITPAATDFDTLLSKGNVKYRVPLYQRGYSWRVSDEVQEFWEDVTENIGEEYFFGSMVINNRNRNRPEIIDGQQRMATVLIFLAAIRDFWSKADNDSARWLHDKYIEDRGIRKRSYYKMELNFSDRDFFRNCILKRPEGRETPKKKARLRTTHKRILEAYNFFVERLTAKIKDEDSNWNYVEKILEQVIHNLKIILISVGTTEDGYTIFETLNDRGLDLSAADLFKNHIFMKAKVGRYDPKRIPVIVNDWDDLAENLDKTDITGFLRHYWLSKIELVRKDDLYKKFKTYIAKKDVNDFVSDLKIYSEYYGAFEDPARENDSNIRDVLYGLNTLKAKGCYPLLLSARAVLDSDEVFAELAKLIEILTFRYSTICNKQANLLERVYHTTAKTLFNSKGKKIKTIIGELKKLIPDNDEFSTNFFRKTMVGIKPQVAYMLRKIEGMENRETTPLGTKSVHIEHIMPQTLTAEWESYLGADLDFYEIDLNRFGNLTLLGNKLGSAASNKPFLGKRDNYYNNSNIAITNKLTKFGKWGREQIEERQRYYLKLALKIWDPEKIK